MDNTPNIVRGAVLSTVVVSALALAGCNTEPKQVTLEAKLADLREQRQGVLDRLYKSGIRNVLALRGDPPKGETEFQATAGGFSYATELVSFIREQGREWCIGAACYPEGHVESSDLETDLGHLVEKVDAGADFLVSQLFFDNHDYRAFVRRARSAGITIWWSCRAGARRWRCSPRTRRSRP